MQMLEDDKGNHDGSIDGPAPVNTEEDQPQD
jgi:hypothetical protein